MSDEILGQEQTQDVKRYKRLVWWVEHRSVLRRIGYGFFVVFDAILLLFVGWTFLDSFVLSLDLEQTEVARMVAIGQQDLTEYSRATAAKPIRETAVQTLSLGDGRFDLVSVLTNPNEQWWAEFTYQFRYAGGQTDVQTGFLLPGEERPVVSLAVESEGGITGARLEFVDVTWNRVDVHRTGSYETWRDARLNMEIVSSAFDRAFEVEGDQVGRVSFEVLNDSAFSYYDPVFLVLLKRGSRIVGVDRITVEDLDAGERLTVEQNWFGTIPAVGKVEIVPEINLFDIDVYKPLVGESTIDTRTRVFERR